MHRKRFMSWIDCNGISVQHFDDSGKFLTSLDELREKHKHFIYFRGLSDDFPLLPSACRGDSHELTKEWIEPFVREHQDEFCRFLHLKKPDESKAKFSRRFELALRDYIETEIMLRFEEIGLDEGILTWQTPDSVGNLSRDHFTSFLQRSDSLTKIQQKYVTFLAKHHGIPTRILDWTGSVDTAAYYAAFTGDIDNRRTDHIVIWAIAQWSWNRSARQDNESEFPEQGRVTMSVTDKGTTMTAMNDPLPLVGYSVFRPMVFPLQYGYLQHQGAYGIYDNVADLRYCESGEWQPFECRLRVNRPPRASVFKAILKIESLETIFQRLKTNFLPLLIGAPLFQSLEEFEQEKSERQKTFYDKIGRAIRSEIDWDTIPV